MNIRAASRCDLPELARSYVEAFKDVDPSELWTCERAMALLNFLFSGQPDLAFLVEDQGIVGGGILGLRKPWWDGDHLVETELFLAPSFQRRGIGTDLLRHFLQEAKDRYQATIMESLTFKDLSFPLAWYRKLGFDAKSDWQVMFGNIDLLLERLAMGV